MFLNALLGPYPYHPSAEMRKLVADMGESPLEDAHPDWWWWSLMVEYREGHEIPISILDDELRSTLDPRDLYILNKTLSREEKRTTIKNLPTLFREVETFRP